MIKMGINIGTVLTQLQMYSNVTHFPVMSLYVPKSNLGFHFHLIITSLCFLPIRDSSSVFSGISQYFQF